MSSDTTTTDAAATDTVLSDFSGVVAELKNSYAGIAAASSGSTSTAGKAPNTAAAAALGKLKIIHNAVAELDASPTLEGMELRADLAEVANMYLPQDTRDVLESTSSSSDVAMELVVRNLTQLPILAKKLYQVRRDVGSWFWSHFFQCFLEMFVSFGVWDAQPARVAPPAGRQR